MTTVAATSRDETPLFFPAGDELLAGVLTPPVGPATGVGVVLVAAGGVGGSTLRNRIHVDLARRLSAEGHVVVRFDFRGVGDSTGVVDRFQVDKPFTEDVRGAVEVAQQNGAREIVLLGSCYGSRAVLVAAERFGKPLGVVLIASPPRDIEHGELAGTELVTQLPLAQSVRRSLRPHVLREMLLDPERRRRYLRFARTGLRAATRRVKGRVRPSEEPINLPATPAFLGPLKALADRRVPVLFIYGDLQSDYRDFQMSLPGPLGGILEEAGSSFEVVALEGNRFPTGTLAGQVATMAALEQWIAGLGKGDTSVGA